MAASKYYFFSDTDLLIAQTAGAYGPIAKTNPTDPDEYRVTSLHTATSNPTAYAACDAIVCLQRVSALLVNVILKPRVQPSPNFAPIKYIIYKGILASSLIDSNGTDVASALNNQLTKFLWDEQAKKNASATSSTNPTAPANALGIDLAGTNFADADPIDNLFYRTGVAFQLPVVKGGWSIGQFDKTLFGIEVLMEGLNFNHPLKLARQMESKISVQSLVGGETEAMQFEHWHAKEQILGFMDPCAFYGSFFAAGVQARTSTNVLFSQRAGHDLYEDVLLPFINRNIAYLDIRNEHNFYFNYFGNYNDIIRVGDPLSQVDYYGSLWPILTLTASNLPTTNTNKARSAFQLQMPEGDNPKPLIYVSQGYRELHAKGNEFPNELKSADRFFDAFLPFGSGYAMPKGASGHNALTFVVPNVTGQTLTTPVSCYIRLKYLKQQQGATAAPKVIQSANYLDNLIWPIELNIPLAGIASIKCAVYDEEIYINASNEAGLDFDAIAKVGIASDADNVSLFLIPTNVRTRKGRASRLVSLSGETSDYAGHYPNFVALKYPREKLIRSDLKLSATNSVPVADFAADGLLARFISADFGKLIMLVIAGATLNNWKTAIASGSVIDKRFRTYLGIKNLQTQADMTGIGHRSFELVLRGYALDVSGNTYEVREVNTGPANSAANVTVYANAGS